MFKARKVEINEVNSQSQNNTMSDTAKIRSQAYALCFIPDLGLMLSLITIILLNSSKYY